MIENKKSIWHEILLKTKKYLASPSHTQLLHCFFRLTHPPNYGLIKLPGRDLCSPLVQYPAKKHNPRGAGWKSPAAAQCKQCIWPCICTKTCKAIKFCKPFVHVTIIYSRTSKQQSTSSLHSAANRTCSLYSLKESGITSFCKTALAGRS